MSDLTGFDGQTEQLEKRTPGQPKGKRAQQRTNRRKEGRQRVPIGAPRLKLQVPEIEGYVMRWFKDEGPRLWQAEQGGWEFVTQEEVGPIGEVTSLERDEGLGAKVSQIGGKDKNGHPQRLYLMKIHREWYDEDQAAKEEQNRQIDEAIVGGRVGGGVDGGYIPSGGIKYQT